MKTSVMSVLGLLQDSGARASNTEVSNETVSLLCDISG